MENTQIIPFNDDTKDLYIGQVLIAIGTNSNSTEYCVSFDTIFNYINNEKSNLRITKEQLTSILNQLLKFRFMNWHEDKTGNKIAFGFTWESLRLKS